MATIARDARLWEIGATQQGTDMNRAYELAGLMASTGEQLALAIGAGGEVALWRDVETVLRPTPRMRCACGQWRNPGVTS